MLWKRSKRNIFDLFNEFFDSVFSDFEEESRDFGRIERQNVKPVRNVQGFSVRISSSPGQEPRVEVQRFGPGGMQKVEPGKIAERPKIQVVEEEAKKEDKEEVPEKPVTFEQPEIIEGRDPKGIFVEIGMKDIDSLEQTNLNFLEESIEVKAINSKKGKGYFWIVKIPPGARKVNKIWAKGRLRLYFSQ